MQIKKWELGPLESRLMGWVQMTGRAAVTTADVADNLRMPPLRAAELVDRMSRDGLAIQLQRGLYLLPQKLPPGGKWQPAVEVAVWYFMTFQKALWQETGAAAFNYYGLSEQIANQTVIYNSKVSAVRKFGRMSVTFIKVAESRLGGAVEKALPSDSQAKRWIGTPERILLDAVYDYSRFGSLPKAYRWIADRKSDEAFLRGLVSMCVKYGNVATSRRIGWLLEALAVDASIYQPLKLSLKRTNSFIPADPMAAKKGKSNMTWNVVENFTL